MTEITAKGHNGTVTFDGAFVTIKRAGLIATATQGGGEKRIPISQVSAVQWKAPTSLTNGFIAFSLAGAIEKQSRAMRQTQAAMNDENSVLVRKKHGAEFEVLRAAIENAIAHRAEPSAPPPGSGADEISRLVALHAAGHLTDTEFSAAKAKVLGL